MGRIVLGLLLALSVFSAVRAAISDLRLCGDPDCREPVSKGVTVISYPSNDKDVLSFHNNVPVIVFSKEAGTRKDLWGVEIHGKRGYAPWKYIREHKVFKSKLNYTVPTERSLGKEKVEHDKPKLSEDLGSQGTKAEEEQASEETTESLDVAKTETDSDFTKSLKVARAAEDVKHNSLPPALPPGEQEEVTTHTIPEGSSVATKVDAVQPTNSEGSTTEGDGHVTEEEKELEEEEEEEGQKDEEEQIKEEEDGSHEELGDHSGVEDKESENETVGKGDDGHVEVAEASTIASPSKDDKKKEETVNREKIISEGDLLVEPSEPPLEPESKPPLPLNLQGPSQKVEVTPKEPEDSSIVTLEPSPVSFEVIDGTTVYLDEDTSTTATTTPTNAQTSEAPIASPVMGEAPPAAATLPIPALLHHLPPASPSNSMVVEKLPNVESPKLTTESESRPSTDSVPLPNLEGQETVEIPASTTESEAAAAAEAELYFNELEVISTAEETEPQPDDSAGKSSKEIEEDFNPLGTGAEVEEAVPTTEVPENDFGAPKQDSIIESNDVTTEEPVESQGFFSSWFGSSETADSLEAEESPETSEPSESEAPLDDTLDVDATLSEDNKDIKDEHNEETTTVHDTPPDAISVPANESEGVSTDAQYPNATDNIDEVTPNSTKDVEKNALKSSEPSVPFVESRSSASPDKEEQSPEVLPPSTDDASSADFVHDTNEAAEGSEEDAGGHLGGGEAEPGPSTARPMYAEPEPTTQSYADASVDTDELAQLAGTKEPADGDAQESSAEGSLIQKFLKASHNMLPEGLAFGVEAEIAEPEVSKGALAFLAIVVFTIITIYVVHLIMMKLSRESPILAALNNMDREKRILLHENATLHEELCKARAELEVMALHITESNGDTTELDAQLELIKKTLDHASVLASETEKQLVVQPEREQTSDEREHAAEAAHQEEKIAQLEHELEEATSNSMEMHKMLSEMLSAQKDTTTFQASVDHLQEMLDGQQEKVEALNSDLALKSRLNEELHLELSASREQVSKLDTQVQQLTQSLKEISNSKEETSQQLLKEIELVKELQTVNESISKQSKTSDEQLSALEQELQALQDTIATLRESVETKDSELKVAKECLKQIQLTSEDSKVVPDDKKLSSLFDVIKIKAELQRVSSERLNLEDQLKDSEMAQKNLEDAMSSIRSEVTELRSMHDEAVHEKQEAMSKLAVLTQYFEEKEAQLTKELESQEGMRMNAEGSAASVAQKIHNYELEVTSYKDIKNLPEAKREMIHRMSMEEYDFADLSPTTGNVPVSDEYKVEWVKAKAELRRKQSAALTTGFNENKEEAAAPIVASILQSFDSSHSSDSAQGLSESPACTVESPVPLEVQSGSKIEQLESTTTGPQVELLPSISVAPNSGNFTRTSFSRPSSLKISARQDSLTAGLATMSDNLPTSSATSNFSSLATQENEPQLSTSVEVPSRTSYDLGLHSAKLVDLGAVVYDDSFDVALQETAASDDVKSSVAAMKSIFERDAQLRSMSETLPYGSSSEKVVSFGTTVKSSLSSRSDLKKEERESSHMNLMLDTKKKTRVESLQKELQAQEESYKTQIASYEQKAHDNWLQARTAERRNEEQRQENSQLRNRLTLLQKEKEGIQGGILKPTPKRLDANGRIPSPGALIEGEVDGDHSETPPHPMHGPPPMLPPMMLPPGAPLPPGIPPPHGFPGVPPPPPPPGMSRGMPPPFLHGELPFMRPPYHPLPGDRRLPPAGGMPSPPYRRSGSPTYNHRNDRYSPSSEHSHLSDRHYSPPPLRHRPPSPDMHRRNHSPDRRSDRLRSPDRRSDRVRASPDHHRSNRRTPDRRLDRRSPDRRFTRSPDGYHRHRASPHDYYDHSDYNSDDSRLHQISSKGKKTSTPLVPSDRWKNDV